MDGPALPASVTKFYTSAAWIDGRAEAQLDHIAGWSGVSQIAAFPDLHPGKYGPIGCAVLADRILPQLIGSDIGCGMSLFALDLPARRFKLEKALRRLRVLGDPAKARGRLLSADLPANLFGDALGSIGGGNHFCEVQQLHHTTTDLDKDTLYLLVHSGSRGLGHAILSGLSGGAFSGLDPDSTVGRTYAQQHDQACRWASLNRHIIAERAAEALRCDLTLITDAPHNILSAHDGGWLHRKGAARANGLVPLAGSRATPSYLMRPLSVPDALRSMAHGAGRKHDRSSMHGRVRAKKSDIAAMQSNAYGGRIICEDRDLMVEEAPQAYKSARSVADDLQTTGVAECIAEFHPLITFKKTRAGS